MTAAEGRQRSLNYKDVTTLSRLRTEQGKILRNGLPRSRPFHGAGHRLKRAATLCPPALRQDHGA